MYGASSENWTQQSSRLDHKLLNFVKHQSFRIVLLLSLEQTFLCLAESQKYRVPLKIELTKNELQA